MKEELATLGSNAVDCFERSEIELKLLQVRQAKAGHGPATVASEAVPGAAAVASEAVAAADPTVSAAETQDSSVAALQAGGSVMQIDTAAAADKADEGAEEAGKAFEARAGSQGEEDAAAAGGGSASGSRAQTGGAVHLDIHTAPLPRNTPVTTFQGGSDEEVPETQFSPLAQSPRSPIAT
jgi:hypothetical protein